MEQPYVGILVNSSLYQGIPSGRTKHEILRFYEDAGRLHGLTPCYFRLQDIRLQSNIVTAYLLQDNLYVRRQLPIPAVIHNRAIYPRSSISARLLQLEQAGIELFNGCNRYSKLYLHELLMKNVLLRPHLPGTMKATANTLNEMKLYYPSLILKPDNSSIGRGVMKLDRTGSGYQLTYRMRGIWRTQTFADTFPLFLRRKLTMERYIVQQTLPLATYQGHPFDLRVSVQRGRNGQWQVTGIAAKVAAGNSFVTNVAQGGAVYRFEEIMQQYPDLNTAQVRSDIADFCLHAADHMSRHLPHLADLGFDIGITTSGFPMFVECNGRDLRYSFQKGNMHQEWRSTYSNPLGYARYLLERKTRSG